VAVEAEEAEMSSSSEGAPLLPYRCFLSLFFELDDLIYGMICADMDGGRQRANNVEVVFLESNAVGAQASSAADNTRPATASSAAANSLTLAEKAITVLPPALGAQASDPKRKARS
jgi:hypothetical protein